MENRAILSIKKRYGNEHNFIWSGPVADPKVEDAETRAIRAFNEKLHHDQRVEIALVPIADGLTLARKLG